MLHSRGYPRPSLGYPCSQQRGRVRVRMPRCRYIVTAAVLAHGKAKQPVQTHSTLVRMPPPDAPGPPPPPMATVTGLTNGQAYVAEVADVAAAVGGGACGGHTQCVALLNDG